MSGTIGYFLIAVAFISAIISMLLYAVYARNNSRQMGRIAGAFWMIKGAAVVGASGILLFLILSHRFEYFYVWNYTSLDLELQYLISSFYGGQEGSFMLWILWSFVIGVLLIRKTKDSFRGPVMFVMGLTQAFLLSMLLGWDIFGVHIGASPFRSLAEGMANAPFLQANPDFIPADGSGLNDLLQSPWMMIHPPFIFFGFAMMTVPFAFAVASLWNKQYNGWIRPALPWTLGANLCLMTAIFLGGYWAYVTLSFGGYWAWDPVENASLVPWLIGTAGIHMMIIQRKSSRAHKGAIFFSILAYIAVVYQTFLTRSGILANSSVHSFVDLGLYNQLLIFMLVVFALGIGFYLYRYKDLPSPEKEASLLSREFMTFTGAILLFILGMVIILGTSSPIIGRFFVENPTPPEIAFYNNWSMPLAIVMAILTVIGQYLFWKRHDWESLANVLLLPLLITSSVTIITIMLANIQSLAVMIFLFAGWFAVIGNGAILIDLLRKRPKMVGGVLSHIGFGTLLLGIIASSIYSEQMLDESGNNYNRMVAEGELYDEQGFPVSQKMEIFQLDLDQPKLINNEYMVTYEGYNVTNSPRPGQQEYRLRFQSVDSDGEFYMYPQVYPMLTNSRPGNIEWSVDPSVRSRLSSDIYMYVAGSSYVEQLNQRAEEQQSIQQPVTNVPVQNIEGVGQETPSVGGTESSDWTTDGGVTGGSEAAGIDTTGNGSDSGEYQKVELTRGQPLEVGPYTITFRDFSPADEEELPDSTLIGVRSFVEILNRPTGEAYEAEPLYSIYLEEGSNWTYAPSLEIPGWGLALQFSGIIPEQDAIELTLFGLDENYEGEWVVIVAQKKPFVSIVWLGTVLLMAGFGLSIFRHRGRNREE